MLTLYKHKMSQATQNSHREEFSQALKEYPAEVYPIVPTNVNRVIQTHVAFQAMRDKHLSASELWEGETLKGKRPHVFTSSIVAAVVIEGTQRSTHYGETYDRLSIQPSFKTGKLIVVKEEVHVDNLQRKMFFLGRTVDVGQAKAYLIKALLDEHFREHSAKTGIIFKNMTEQVASLYLQENFEQQFCAENAALFHVEHGVQGEEDDPIETWRLVRLDHSLDPAQNAELKDKISSMVSVKLYLETIKALEKGNVYARIKPGSTD